MDCPDHEGKRKIMVCVTCKTAVCEQCIDDSHDEHSLKSFEATAKNVSKPTEKQSYTTLEKHLQDVSTIRQREGEQAVKTKQELLDRRDQLKQILEKVTDTAVATLDQHNENLFKKLDEAKDKAMGKSKEISDFKSEAESLMSSKKYMEVVKKGWKIEITPLEFPKVSRLVFMPDMSVDATNIEILFGELVQQDLKALTTSHPDSTSSTPVSGQYNSNLSRASSICTLDLYGEGPEEAISDETQLTGPTDVSSTISKNALKCNVKLTHKRSFNLTSVAWLMQPTVKGECWFKCYGKDNTVTLVSATGNEIQNVSCTTTVNGIVVLPVTNQVLLACLDKKCIKKVMNKQDKYTLANSKWINTDPFAPVFMCVTTNGDILVTMTDRQFGSEEPNSASVLVKYNSKGKEVARAHKDGHGQDLFFVPVKVRSSTTGTVAVVNSNSTHQQACHLVVFDSNLNLTYRYISHGQSVPSEEELPELPGKFCITDVLFNHQSLLLVSEIYSRTVQLLDPMCNLLKVLVTDLHDLPYSLALHADGDLWVGLKNRTVQVYNHTCDFTSEEK